MPWLAASRTAQGYLPGWSRMAPPRGPADPRGRRAGAVGGVRPTPATPACRPRGASGALLSGGCRLVDGLRLDADLDAVPGDWLSPRHRLRSAALRGAVPVPRLAFAGAARARLAAGRGFGA